MKALVVGAGRVGSSFDQLKGKDWVNTHLGAYKKNSRISEIAICDVDPNVSKRASKLWGIPTIYSEISEAIRDFSPTVVSLCIPPEHNLPAIRELVKHGAVRLLWVEKPFSDSVANARQQVGLLKEHEINFLTNYQRRFDPSYEKVKMEVQDLLGEIQKCVCFFSGGVVNTASHLINLLIYYFGTPRSCEALNITKLKSGIFHGDFRLIFEGFDAYALEVNPAASILSGAYSILEIQLVGSKGKLIIKSLPFNEVEFDYSRVGNSRFEGIKILEATPLNIKHKRLYMERELETLLERENESVLDCEDALETLLVLHQIGVIE